MGNHGSVSVWQENVGFSEIRSRTFLLRPGMALTPVARLESDERVGSQSGEALPPLPLEADRGAEAGSRQKIEAGLPDRQRHGGRSRVMMCCLSRTSARARRSPRRLSGRDQASVVA